MQAAVAAETPHLFTVAEFVTLDTQCRTELLGGVVYDVSPRNEPHRFAVRKLAEILIHELPRAEYIVQTQDMVAVPGWHGRDAPEVDVAVLKQMRFRPGPKSSDALTLIEVSHTTYRTDRGYKIPLYVNHGIPSWIVNITMRQVESYVTVEDLEQPHGRVFAVGETFEVRGVRIAVADLFDDLDGIDENDEEATL